MQRSSLEGRSILVVEDQPQVALDITQQFEASGAALTTTNTLKHALILVEHDGLAGAVLEHGWSGALHIAKPAAEGALVQRWKD